MRLICLFLDKKKSDCIQDHVDGEALLSFYYAGSIPASHVRTQYFGVTSLASHKLQQVSELLRREFDGAFLVTDDLSSDQHLILHVVVQGKIHRLILENVVVWSMIGCSRYQ